MIALNVGVQVDGRIALILPHKVPRNLLLNELSSRWGHTMPQEFGLPCPVGRLLADTRIFVR